MWFWIWFVLVLGTLVGAALLARSLWHRVTGTTRAAGDALGALFYTVGVIYGRNQRVVPLLMVAAIWYVIITTVITVIQFYVERHYAKGAVRTLPPTPLQVARWTVLRTWSRLTGRPPHPSLPPAFAVRTGNGRGHLTRTGRPTSTTPTDGGVA